jgi:DNA-binding transcriptional MocR family regulator
VKFEFNKFIVTMTIIHPDAFAQLIDAVPRSGPRYRAIADAVAEGIASGALADGERLPPMRDLAFRLSVTTGTVARAYALAATRGHVGGEVGRGTYIRGRAHARPLVAAEDAFIAMKANLPADVGQGERLAGEMATLAGNLDRHAAHRAFGYCATGGEAAHREAGAQWISTDAFAPTGDEVLVCSGAQQAMLAAMLAATDHGDLILTESLTYHAVVAQAALAGRRLAPVELDDEGIAPEALAEACAALQPRALFIVPTLHNPTTATMSEARRARIAEIAAAHKLAVIEDDLYANLMETRPLPLAHLLPEQSYYVNGLSKAVAPGLRIAYLKPPRDRLERTRAILNGLGQTLPTLMADLAARVLTNGMAEEIVAAQRAELAIRHGIAAARIPTLRKHPAAMHGWLPLPDDWRASAFVEAARLRGVSIGAGDEFMVGQPDRAARHVRLCLGAPASRSDMEQGLAVVAELLANGPGEAASLA